jgi:F-type H+-transporting ATPase subunit beta
MKEVVKGMEEKNYGTVVQVIGPVVDIEFPPDQLPDLNDAIIISSEDQDEEIKKTMPEDLNVILEAALNHLHEKQISPH